MRITLLSLSLMAMVLAFEDAALACNQPPCESIGFARMLDDGTIELHLRAEGPRGIVGHGHMEVRREDHLYQRLIDHLGGIRPGEQKTIPPWPD